MKKKDTFIQSFARFAHDTRYEDIPQSVVQKVKLQVLNCLTAMKFSDWHPDALKIFDAEKKQDAGNGGSTVIAINEKLDAERAAIVNTAFAMSLDFDDYMLMGHMSHSSVIPALALLEEKNGEMRELIVAATAANEVMGRLALSCFFGPLNGQMWSYVHHLGAATALARVKNLDRTRMANAMGLSLYQPNFCLFPGFWTEGCKLLTAAMPARVGIQAVKYAEEGLQGPLDVIEGDFGFLHFFSFHPIKEMLGDLGDAWLSETLSYKRYPGTSYIGGPVDAALAALNELGIEKIEDVNDIKKILVETTVFSNSMEQIAKKQVHREVNSILINFSVSHSVAYALLQGDLLPPHFKEEEIKKYKDRITELVKKIEVRHDMGMTARTFSTIPQVARIFKRMKLGELRRLSSHLRAMRTSKRSFISMLKGLIKFISNPYGRVLAKNFFRRDTKPINLVDMNLPDFPMYQSARAIITLENGKTAISEFLIPRGGAGIDLETRKKWVEKRFE
ncbi:MAG: MmgE/PrpD family protein, partial [Candidatus Hodarchaeota archaeon]